jgi:peptide/nickel transport system substrate-binding protein
MRKVRNIAIILMVLLIGAGTLFAGGGQQSTSGGGATVTPYNLPRNQTLYFNGLQWGAPSGNSPYVANASNFASGGHRQVVYETLFVYNLLDGKLYPQIGDSYSWNVQARTLTVQLNRNVKFSDGTPLTAADVVYSFDLAKKYVIGASGYWDYLDSVTAQGDYTVVLTGKAPPNFNMKSMEQAISEFSITSRAYWEGKLRSGELDTAPSALIGFPGWDCIGTGPYMPMYHDDIKLVIIRNDSYWGQHSSRYGKLPAPKYIAHNIYRDNAAGDEAFRRGEIDVSQQYIAQIWTFFNSGAETYVPQAPYYIPGVIPSIIFNTTRPGLNDPAVRRAIAMVLDYDMIGTNAMSGYTAPKQAHMMVPLPQEMALIDLDALKPYQWEGIDTAGANRILDQAGWVRGSDGVRAKGGVRLAFRVECPAGWSDWNASLEVVAQSTRAIGMNITTYFPEAPVWTADRLNNTFDIIMDSPGGQGIGSPWTRANAVMGSNYLPPVGTPNPIGNYGRYVNAEAQQIINQIPNETNDATLKQLWTRLNIIYLQEMPAAGLMYRPWLFHTVNTSVWTNFPKLGDGTNVPPTIMIDGYGIKGLYNLRLK